MAGFSASSQNWRGAENSKTGSQRPCGGAEIYLISMSLECPVPKGGHSGLALAAKVRNPPLVSIDMNGRKGVIQKTVLAYRS